MAGWLAGGDGGFGRGFRFGRGLVLDDDIGEAHLEFGGRGVEGT